MGSYCYINAHFPVTAFSSSEQSLLADLRRLLPYDEEWLKLPYQEKRRRQEAAHKELGIPGDADDWQFVRQWKRDNTWYVHGRICPSVTPPFPTVLAEYDSLGAKNHLPPVWLVAFTAPGRWQSEYWSIFQTLSETRRHVLQLFGKLWSLFYLSEYHGEFVSDPHDLRTLRLKAPPGSPAQKRLRAVFGLFKLCYFTSLHRLVLSRDLPEGTVLELDILDFLYSGTEEEAAAKLKSDQHLRVIEAVETMDLAALVKNELLQAIGDYDEDVIPWLNAADAWCEASQYLLDHGD